MRAGGLKTLKNWLSEYVRLVANGETLLVTDRDRVVAELTPPLAGLRYSRAPISNECCIASLRGRRKHPGRSMC
jgi:antitoxin (DNA-binding transcriptional repressor) of toxin-antitoxin stability system